MTQITGIALRAFLPFITDAAKNIELSLGEIESICTMENMTNLQNILTTVLVASSIILVAAIVAAIVHREPKTAKKEA